MSSSFSNLLACSSFRAFPSPTARTGFFTMNESSFHNQNSIPVEFLQQTKTEIHGERLFSPFANKQVPQKRIRPSTRTRVKESRSQDETLSQIIQLEYGLGRCLEGRVNPKEITVVA